MTTKLSYQKLPVRYIKQVTDKAVRVRFDNTSRTIPQRFHNRDVWVPLTVLSMDSDEKIAKKERIKVLEIADWWVEKP